MISYNENTCLCRWPTLQRPTKKPLRGPGFSPSCQRICVFSFTSKNQKKHSCNLKLFSNITAPSAHDTWPHVTAWPRAVKFLWSALSRKREKSEDKKRNDAPVSPSSVLPPWPVFPGLPLNIYSLIIEMILRRTKKGRGENENIAKGTTDPGIHCIYANA